MSLLKVRLRTIGVRKDVLNLRKIFAQPYLPTTTRTYVNRVTETGSCYYVVNWTLPNYAAMRELCKRQGGHLLVLDDENERRVVRGVIEDHAPGHLKDLFVYVGYEADWNRNWYTVNGDLLSDIGYAPWEPGQPKNRGGYDNCGCLFLRTATLHDCACWDHRYGLCEKPVLSALLKYT